MKTNFTRWSALVILGALLGPLAAVADEGPGPDTSHPKAFVKDSVITTKVKSKLAADRLTSLAKIHVDTDDSGIVWLKGTTPTQAAADRAVAIARATEHVVDVHSDIMVEPAN
jgi:hyperosmotically inducible protein